VVDRRHDRRTPILPAWLRNGDQRGAFLRETARFLVYVLVFHAVRLPKYTVLTAAFAPLGVLRLAGRQLRWWWVLEQHAIRQHAAGKNDAETWLKLHHEAKRTRAGRGLWLLAELASVSGGTLALILAAPAVAQATVAAVLVPVLARFGRPEGRPITDRVYSGRGSPACTPRWSARRCARWACPASRNPPRSRSRRPASTATGRAGWPA
jgi:DNA segregation ATPase FtsK/SpoIIIE, S-DNA-T family